MQDIVEGQKVYDGYFMIGACRERFSAGLLSESRDGKLECRSSNSSIMQAGFDERGRCHVYFAGTETTGGDADVIVKYNKQHSSRVPFRVWFPEAMSIVASDNVLQPIAFESESSSCPVQYQSSTLQAIATFSGPAQEPALRNIDVTELVKFKVLSPESSMLTISGSTVQRQAGFVSAEVGCDGPTTGPCGVASVTLSASSSKITVQDLVVWTVGKTEIKQVAKIAPGTKTDKEGLPVFKHAQTIEASAMLTSRLTTAGDTATLFARARFSDGTWSRSLTKETGLLVTSNKPCVEVDNSGSLVQVKVPSDPFECFGKNVLSIDWVVGSGSSPCTLGSAKNPPDIRVEGRDASHLYVDVTGMFARTHTVGLVMLALYFSNLTTAFGVLDVQRYL